MAQNVAEIRNRRGMSLRALAEQLGQLGHRMLVSTISKIENADRKVNADDLVALALALDVSPPRLWLPGVDDGRPVQLTPEVAVPWGAAWRWATGWAPLDTRTPAETLQWLRRSGPHNDAAIVAAWMAVVEQTPGVEVQRDEQGRVVAITGPDSAIAGLPTYMGDPDAGR